jgi:hypothetical protein
MRKLYLKIRSMYDRLTRFRSTKSNNKTNPDLRPGQHGERLPDQVIVLRLASLPSDGIPRATPEHFNLSSEDKASELQSLTVWAKDLTPAKKAREFMGEKKALYRVILYLNVDHIRAIRVPSAPTEALLDVVWDRDGRHGAEGHAGITGLMCERIHRKALRVKLADLAKAELFRD